MSQESFWTLEEMSRTMRAERMADAERYRRLTTVGCKPQSPRLILAQALRSLASLLDGEVTVQAHPDRQLARAV